ncbi:hypothetical protein pb186bvf_003757 [Paramecium bursaria]
MQQYWPIFQEDDPCMHFWNKNPISNLTYEHKFKLNRVSIKKQKPTQYEYCLSKDGVLYYKKGKLRPWTKLNLSASVKICEYNKWRVIRLKKNDKNIIYLWHTEFSTTITLFKLLQKFCFAQNFDILYQLDEILGRGGFSKVYKLIPQKGQPNKIVAGKIYDKQELVQKKDIKKFYNFIKTECYLLQKINSPYVLKLFEVIQMEEVLVLVTEFVKGGTLYQYLKDRKKICEAETLQIMLKICLGLQQVHELGYVHRDIKLENVLIDGDIIKLIDFGFAEEINRNHLLSGQGTAGYIAPEVFMKQPYTETSDVFSLGVIMYSLLAGRAPFKSATYEGLLAQNKQCLIDYSDSKFMGISIRTLSLLKMMLKPNRFKRINLQDLIYYLQNTSSIPEISCESLQSIESSHPSIMYSKNTMRSFFQQSLQSFSEETSRKSFRLVSVNRQKQSKSEDKRSNFKQSTFKPSLLRIHQALNEDSNDQHQEEDVKSENDEREINMKNILHLKQSYICFNEQKFL